MYSQKPRTLTSHRKRADDGSRVEPFSLNAKGYMAFLTRIHCILRKSLVIHIGCMLKRLLSDAVLQRYHSILTVYAFNVYYSFDTELSKNFTQHQSVVARMAKIESLIAIFWMLAASLLTPRVA